MRVLVTGGAGNIGREVVQCLHERAHDVVIYDLVPYRGPVPATVEIADISDRERLDTIIGAQAIEGVIHLAALLQFGCDRNPVKAVETNIKGTLNVLDAARSNGIERVVLASSSAIYGGRNGQAGEERPWGSNISLYGTTKLIGERLAQRYNALYGMECRSLRYGAVLSGRRVSSPGMAAALAEIFSSANGKDVTIDGVSASERRHFVSVHDVALGTVLALEATKTKSDVFNIVGGDDCYASFQKIADLIHIICPGAGTATFTGFAGDRESLGISRARAELGYQPALSLARAIEDAVRRMGEQRSSEIESR